MLVLTQSNRIWFIHCNLPKLAHSFEPMTLSSGSIGCTLFLESLNALPEDPAHAEIELISKSRQHLSIHSQPSDKLGPTLAESLHKVDNINVVYRNGRCTLWTIALWF